MLPGFETLRVWPKVPPNNMTFVSVALSLGRAGRPLESLDVLDMMRERGTPPDAICCQTVLRVLDRWNKPAEALALFEDMRRRGFAAAPGPFGVSPAPSSRDPLVHGVCLYAPRREASARYPMRLTVCSAGSSPPALVAWTPTPWRAIEPCCLWRVPARGILICTGRLRRRPEEQPASRDDFRMLPMHWSPAAKVYSWCIFHRARPARSLAEFIAPEPRVFTGLNQGDGRGEGGAMPWGSFVVTRSGTGRGRLALMPLPMNAGVLENAHGFVRRVLGSTQDVLGFTRQGSRIMSPTGSRGSLMFPFALEAIVRLWGCGDLCRCHVPREALVQGKGGGWRRERRRRLQVFRALRAGSVKGLALSLLKGTFDRTWCFPVQRWPRRPTAVGSGRSSRWGAGGKRWLCWQSGGSWTPPPGTRSTQPRMPRWAHIIWQASYGN